MTRSIVVTGGAGFIGANLCRGLSARFPAARITAFDDLSSGLAGNLAGVKGVELVEGSILDPHLMNEVVADADTVVHLAARPSVQRSLESPLETHEANATGTLRVLEASRKAVRPHVVLASSSSVYGANRALRADETGAVMPLSPYPASKLAGESYALSHASAGPVNLAFGGRSSILGIVAMLERILGRTLERRHSPPRSGDVRDSQADRRRLTELFPDATPEGLKEGLRATVEWFEPGETDSRRSFARLSEPVR